MGTRYNVLNATGAAATTVLTAVATGTALKTLLQISTAATTPVVVVEWGVSFDGTNSAAAPVQVRLQRQTTAGTGGTAGAIVKYSNPASQPTANTTSLTAPAGTWTAEPTASDIIGGPWFVNPTSGMVQQYPLGREITLDVSTRLAIVSVSAASVNAMPYFVIEE